MRGAVLRGWVELPAWMADALTALKPLGFDEKTFQHPLRLLSVLALAYLAGHAVRRSAAWLHGRVAAPLVLMGQHGLSVFCATVALSFLARVAFERSGGDWPAQIVVNATGFASLVAVAVVASWLKPQRGLSRNTPIQELPAGPEPNMAARTEAHGTRTVLAAGAG